MVLIDLKKFWTILFERISKKLLSSSLGKEEHNNNEVVYGLYGLILHEDLIYDNDGLVGRLAS